MGFRKNLAYSVFAWIILVLAAFAFNYSKAVEEQRQTAFNTARAVIDMIKITRLWNAGHGGVYVMVDEKNQPNPYLRDPLRDIVVNERLQLTKINPAFMTRQISELSSCLSEIEFHLTSLKPINPGNRPDPLERKTLLAFAAGAREKGIFIKRKGKTYCFYMVPLVTREACLRCHAQQGYQVGDIRGGISVRFPFTPERPLLPMLFGYVVVGLVGLLGIFISAGKLKAAYEKLERQAKVDSLTGVLNRYSLLERLPQEYRRCRRYRQPLAVIMADVDDFKLYNDTFGHVAGDQCLRQVAAIIKTSLERAGDFCARYGGEEFIVVLPDTDIDGALHVAEQIRSRVEKAAVSHPRSPFGVVTLSLGVAAATEQQPLSPEELVRRADTALYQAKQEGKNRVRPFSPS
ncbi:MAG: diguanylate cyclase [Deltaproteobacteria bacterium]|nr:diguanylate cyclase [Deltaproteobacteria bacterium]